MPDASVPVMVVVGVGGADIATVVVTAGGGGAGGRLDIVDKGEGADAAVVGVSVVDASPLPPRVAYMPSAAAATSLLKAPVHPPCSNYSVSSTVGSSNRGSARNAATAWSMRSIVAPMPT
jgi:hypothetical protein